MLELITLLLSNQLDAQRKMFNQQTKTKEKEGKVIGIVQDTPIYSEN